MEIEAVRGVRMLATATVFPREVSADARSLRNEEVLALLGHGDGPIWVERAARWGVRQREWLEVPGGPRGGADLVDLAEGATRAALDRAGVRPGEVDALFLATSTPSRISSSAAARLARRLGTSGLAVELRGGGAGALQGLVLAAATRARRAVVVAAEVLSATLDPRDPAMTLLYADGAGAVVLARDDGHPGGLAGGQLGTADLPGRPFTIPGRLPPVQEDLDAGAYVFQTGDRVYLEALAGVWDATADRLRAFLPEGATVAPYPVTRPLGERVAARLGVPWERVAFPLAEHGCVGSAGVLAALHEARVAAPDRPVGLIAVGGGVTWGALVWLP